MGVSGCGKSSVAQACAQALGWALHEGDAYHAPESIAKMRAGIALTDADRTGWLDRLAALLAPQAAPQGVVLTCSALRRKYRDRLRQAQPALGFVFLQLDFEAALARVQARPGHFFSPALVADQFATLEPPVGEPGVLTLDATRPVSELVDAIVQWVHGGASTAPQPTEPASGGAA
ncbi:gluconokinase [Paenacidovorax monticola]|uniref:Gluconokinase n=2 Tax=Paenacidovorax monticola TaxID=1926868 RepID=A0A7H0HL55_9BURK|nr:gluconokinase [Paenacidovorax monticola]